MQIRSGINTMIDTVELSIPVLPAELLGGPVVGMPVWNYRRRGPGYEVLTLGTRSMEKREGVYYPVIEGILRSNKGVQEASVKIKFSVPKLMYGNNVDELTGKEFKAVINVLQIRLRALGLGITTDSLANAIVRTLHYGKNVELKNGHTARHAISELRKVNLTKRLTLKEKVFANDGEGLYFGSKPHSLVFYDKAADLRRGRGKALDASQEWRDTELARSIEGRNVLRMEVRLNNKRKINAVFNHLGLGSNPTFKDVFSRAKSRKVLRDYWDTYIAGDSVALFANMPSPQEILKQVLIVLPAMRSKAKEAVYRTGLILLARDIGGMRGLRSLLGAHCDSRAWYGLVKDIRGVAARIAKLNPRGWYGQIEKALDNYQPFQLDSKRSGRGKIKTI